MTSTIIALRYRWMFFAFLVSSAALGDGLISMHNIKRQNVGNLAARADTQYQKTQTLDSSFNNVYIFGTKKKPSIKSPVSAVGGIELSCRTCYIKGKATALLQLDDSFDFQKTVNNLTSSFEDTIDYIAEWGLGIATDFFDDIGDEIDDIGDDLFGGDDNDEDEDDNDGSTTPDFDIDIPELPETVLEFRLSGGDFYFELHTLVDAGVTYRIPLAENSLSFSKDDKGGFLDDLGLDFRLGLDLILTVVDGIEFDWGFHIKFEEDLLMKAPLFSDEVNDMSLDGGKFEFLPVSIKSGSTTIRAVLQLSLTANFDSSKGILDALKLDAHAGLAAGVYANLMDVNTTISSQNDHGDCDFNIKNEFQFGVGASAGAVLELGLLKWGPTPSTDIPLFTTTLADRCVTLGEVTSIAGVDANDDVETTTITTTMGFIGMRCSDQGKINCPADQQIWTTETAEATVVTAVSMGAIASWPEVTNGVTDTKDFGSNAIGIGKTSGKPEPTSESFFDQDTGGVSNKIIVGVSVGVGGALIMGFILFLCFCISRRKKQRREYYRQEHAPNRSGPPVYSGGYQNQGQQSYGSQGAQGFGGKRLSKSQ